jgi:hypothetical protein
MRRKKTSLRRLSKQPISVLQRKLWELCKQIIRLKYGNTCYTCGQKNLIGSNWHTGHMWAKASLGANLKYDLRILRPQCYHCNINLGGRGADFYRKMLEEIGEEKMNQLVSERSKIVKAYDFYFELLVKYQLLLNEMKSNSSLNGSVY